MSKLKTMKCQHCQSEFQIYEYINGHKGKYCSRNCFFANKAKNENSLHSVPCLECNRLFKKRRGDKKAFCTNRCSIKRLDSLTAQQLLPPVELQIPSMKPAPAECAPKWPGVKKSLWQRIKEWFRR